MEKIIIVDDKEVKIKATAALPRLYRIYIGRDIMQDMLQLKKAYINITNKQLGEELDDSTAEAVFSVLDLQIFEDIAFVMAKHADSANVPGTAAEWLEQFNTFSIYEVLPDILSLWLNNEMTLAESKKKHIPQRGR